MQYSFMINTKNISDKYLKSIYEFVLVVILLFLLSNYWLFQDYIYVN